MYPMYDPAFMSMEQSKAMAAASRKATMSKKRRNTNRNRNTGLRGEIKSHDVAMTGLITNSTGLVQCVNLIAAGTDYNQRIGRQVHIKSIEIRAVLPPMTTELLNRWKLMLVWDKQPNGALAAVSDILDTATSVSMNNLENRNRFRVIRTWGGLNGYVDTTNHSSSEPFVNMDEFVKLSLKTTYNAATANIADISTGALLLLAVGSEATGTTFIGNVRVKFLEV